MNQNNIELPKNIETVFKVEQPISEVKEGYFGYSGVLLRDSEKDLIQCHMCGEWFEHLSQHIRLSHKITIRKYRKKFGLPLRFPLCNKKYSEKARETLLANLKKMSKEKREKVGKADPTLKGIKAAASKQGKKAHFYSYHNASWDNKKGACPAQLEKRYLVVADIVGRDPSKLDLEAYDPPLYSLIYRRGMTLNEFRKKYGFEVRKKADKVTEDQIIACLRKKFKEKRAIPVARDFWRGTPSYTAIVRKYGSYRKALMAANIIE